jgi:hypothetical protein
MFVVERINQLGYLKDMSVEPHQDLSESDEMQLCISCMAPNEVTANFCANCRAPLSSYASTGPFEHIFAEGAVYRQAANRPRKLIVVLGVWLLFGVMFLAGLWRCIFGLSQDEVLGTRIIVSLFGFAVVVVSGAMIWKTARNYLAQSKRG